MRIRADIPICLKCKKKNAYNRSQICAECRNTTCSICKKPSKLLKGETRHHECRKLKERHENFIGSQIIH